MVGAWLWCELSSALASIAVVAALVVVLALHVVVAWRLVVVCVVDSEMVVEAWHEDPLVPRPVVFGMLDVRDRRRMRRSPPLLAHRRSAFSSPDRREPRRLERSV
jgi:hypothetical protein